MIFNFHDLNNYTRMTMLDEIQGDILNNRLYFSKRFSPIGIEDYPTILVDHVKNGNEVSLGNQLKQNGRFNSTEQTKTGIKKVPFDAHETFAEGEFNRFYVRALCLIAIQNNKKIKVYRAKEVVNARTASLQKIGEYLDPNILLKELRENVGFDVALSLPQGPNSGLSIELI